MKEAVSEEEEEAEDGVQKNKKPEEVCYDKIRKSLLVSGKGRAKFTIILKILVIICTIRCRPLSAVPRKWFV